MAAISRRSEMTYSGCKAAIPPGGIFVSCLQMEQDRTSFASSFSFSRQVWQKTWRQFKILGCLSFSSQILHVCSSSPSRLMFGMGDTSRDCSGEAAGDISGEDMACLSKRNKDDTLCETRHWDSVLPHRISELNIIYNIYLSIGQAANKCYVWIQFLIFWLIWIRKIIKFIIKFVAAMIVFYQGKCIISIFINYCQNTFHGSCLLPLLSEFFQF